MNFFRSLELTFALTALACVEVALNPASAAVPCDRANPESCLYVSDLNYRDGQIGPFLLVDPARNNYEFSVLIRYPLGAPLP
jgi:hypothetical protein